MDKRLAALLQIGSQHPAWSSTTDGVMVRLFNEVTALAREAVDAVGQDDDAKADWCEQEYAAKSGCTEPAFYVQNLAAGYAYNSPIWWAKGGNGYTQWIVNAEAFTEEDADKLVLHDPHKWVKWRKQDIDSVAKLTVDMQNIGVFRIPQPKK